MVVLSECFTKIIDIAMTTFYVLFDEFSRSFVRAGRQGGYTYSLNNAKHFTSDWSAEHYRINNCLLAKMIIKKIVIQ